MINQDKKIVDGTNIELYDQAKWSRTTVADGNWLQSETLDPISANDRILASAIHDVSATLQDEIDYLGDELYNTSSYLNEEITKINARADVIDVVGNHEAFEERSAHLVPSVDISDRDVIKVLNDVGDDIPAWVLDNGSYVLSSIDTNNQQSYYRWLSAVDGNTSGWEYVGSLEPYYKDIELSENNITFENTAPERNYSIKADTNRYIQITPYNHDASIGLSDDFINSANLAFETYDALSSISGINDGSITGPRVNHLVSNFSLAQGSANSASYYSFSQGLNNSAENDSLAQGANNKANNRGQALGYANSANSDGFAAGQNNNADINSFAQGTNCSAKNQAFAQGNKVSAENYSIGIGKDIKVTNNSLAIGYHSYYVDGKILNVDDCSVSIGKNASAGDRTCLIGENNSCKDRLSFAQGSTNYVREESFAQGVSNSADYRSLAQGYSASAYTDSLAQGGLVTAKNESLAQGSNITANDDSLAQGEYISADERSMAQGCNASAHHNSFAQGYTAYAYDDSFAQGDYVSAKTITFAQGRDTSAYYHSFAQGNNTSADMEGFAQGKNAQASNQSFAQGYNITATTTGFAQGDKCKANNIALAQGQYASANDYSMAQGQQVSAKNRGMAQGINVNANENSFAQGYNVTATTAAFAQGSTVKSNYYSISQGINTSAQYYSIAQGYATTADDYSQSFGLGTKMLHSGMAIGTYNSADNVPFVIGNGTRDDHRSDLFLIDRSGNVSAAGNVSAINFYINGNPIDSVVSAKFSAYNGDTKIAELPISAFKLQANTAKYISATTVANTMIFNVSDALIGSAQSGKTAYNILSSTKISAVGQGLSNTGFAYLSAGFRISAGDNLTIATAANNTIQLNSTPGINTYFSNEGYDIDPTGTTGLITGISAKYNNDSETHSYIINQSVVFGTTGGAQISGLLIQPANNSQDNYVLTHSTADNSYTWKEGGIQQVYHDSNLSGNGTQDSLLGLKNLIKLSASDGQTTISNNGITIAGSQNNASIILNNINYGSTPIMTWNKGETTETVYIEDIQKWKAKPNISADKQIGQGTVSSLDCVSMEYVDILGAGPKGLLFKDKNNTQVSAHVIPSGTTGFLYCYGPDRAIGGRAPTTGDTTASSGCYWDGSDNINYIYLNDLNNEGKPLKLIMPANCIADIFYECNVNTYNCTSENILFGLKPTSGQNKPDDYIATSYINFPPESVGGRGIGHQSCMLRVYNSNNQSFEMYPAFYKGYGGGDNPDTDYYVGSDKFVIRYYTF